MADRDGKKIAHRPAMALAFPEDPAAAAFEEQYLLGPALLVAPVLRPGGWTRCYLPAGRWYDFWDQQRVDGPRVIERTVPLDQMLIYGREGCLLPLGPVVQRTDDLDPDGRSLELLAFGLPRWGLELPGLRLDVDAGIGGSRMRPLPVGARVSAWGGVRVERRNAEALFWRAT